MPEIKTRETVRDIKTLDRTGDLQDHMRTAMIRSRERLEAIDTESSESAENYAEEEVERGVADASESLKQSTEHAIERGREAYREHRAEQAEEQARTEDYPETESTHRTDQEIRVRETPERDIKTREKVFDNTSDNGSVKTSDKSVKSQERTVKTAESGGKKSIKTAEHDATKGAETAKEVSKTGERVEKAKQAVKEAGKKTAEAVKAAVAAVKGFVAFLAAGGWIVVVIIAAVGVVAAILMSALGIFFGNDKDSMIPLHKAVTEISMEYQDEIDLTRVSVMHDREELKGARSPWKDVLAIYAVRTAMDPTHPMEVTSMTKEKKERLRAIFWRMNSITTKIERRTAVETVTEINDDGEEIEVEQEIEEDWLVITVNHKTAWEMADVYKLTDEQREQLAVLMDPAYDDVWMGIMYRYHSRNYKMVGTALNEVGNIGGEKYWRWYGFSSRVEWCAVFACWVADQNGYIDEGFCPKFSQCAYGVRWFIEHDRWIDGSMEPLPGMLIFFDWDTPDGKYGPQDGHSDHVGIVEKVEDGIVYTIEGNCQDMCKQKQYPVGWYEIMGYGGIR